MPRFAVSKVQDALNERGKAVKGSRILILGRLINLILMTCAKSPALDVIALLKKKGAEVSYHDPHIASLKHDAWEMASVPDLLGAVKAAECVVIVTNHSVYDYPAILDAASLVVDTRNALGALGRSSAKVVRL